MKPPITPIPGICADWNAIGMSMRAANDPGVDVAVQEWEDEGGRVVPLKAPPPKPPAGRP